MNILESALSKVKQKAQEIFNKPSLSDNVGWVRQGQFTPITQLTGKSLTQNLQPIVPAVKSAADWMGNAYNQYNVAKFGEIQPSGKIDTTGSLYQKGIDLSKGIAKFGQESVLQPGIRLFPEAYLGARELVTGEKLGEIPVSQSPVDKFLLGEKPLSSPQYRTGQWSQTFQQYGVPAAIAIPLAATTVAGGEFLDLLPGVDDILFKGGKKIVQKGGQKIAIEFAANQIEKRLLEQGLGELMAKEIAQKEATSMVEKRIAARGAETIAKTAEEISKEAGAVTKTTEKALKKVEVPSVESAISKNIKTITPEVKPIVELTASGKAKLIKETVPTLKAAEAVKLTPEVKPKISLAPETGKMNVEKLNLTKNQKILLRTLQEEFPQTVITQKDIVELAKTADPFKTPVSDQQIKQYVARQLASRQETVSLIKNLDNLKKSGASDLELLTANENIIRSSYNPVTVAKQASTVLNAQKIMANELLSPQQKIINAILDAYPEKQREGIIKKLASETVNLDWNNAKQVVDLYRKYVPAKFWDVVDEIRYTNMLSSPLTHLINLTSNFLMTGIVRPVAKTLTGVLDWSKSALTGSERKYFANQGLDYMKGYYGALPQAWDTFKKVMREGALTGKIELQDLKRLPTSTTGVMKWYTTPLRALEASDQFFRILTRSGEMKTGMSLADAEKSATYQLFRQAFDPENKLGQGTVLSFFDKFNSAMMRMREVPGVGWFVPFMQTPTNILKQGLEYSPLGIATAWGSKEPLEQLSKWMIGSGVYATAMGLAGNNLITWEAPRDEKARQLFYDAGLQEYSVKIGDKWVSFSKLGPLSYPMAMAAALHNAYVKNPDQGTLENLANGLMSSLQFFSDQSYVEQFGNLVDAIRGGKLFEIETAKKSLSDLVRQSVPYASFMGWLTRLVDPVYRKPEGLAERIMSGIPGLSTQVGYYETPQWLPSERTNPILSSFVPAKITTEKPENLPLYQAREQQLLQNAIEKRAGEKLLEESKKGITPTPEPTTQTTMPQKKNYQYVKDGELVKVSLTTPQAPTLTGDALTDKAKLTSYSNKVGTQISNIAKLNEDGQIDDVTAQNMILDLDYQRDLASKLQDIPYPKLTGQKEVDKKLLSSYYSSLTTQISAIAKWVEAGKIDAVEGEKMIRALNAKKAKGKKVTLKKPKKLTLKAAKIKAPKAIKLPTIKAPKIKLAKLKTSKPTKLSKLKTKTIKV